MTSVAEFPPTFATEFVDYTRIRPEFLKYQPTVVVVSELPGQSTVLPRTFVRNGGIKINRGFDFDGTDDYIDLGPRSVGNHSAHTVVVTTFARSIPASYAVLFNYITTGSVGRRKIFYSDTFGYTDITIGAHGQFGGGDDVANLTLPTGVSLFNSQHRLVFKFAGTTNGTLSGWCNGRPMSRGLGAGTNTQTGDNCIGRGSTNDASNYFNGKINFLIVFNSLLPDTLCAAVSANPNLIFESLVLTQYFAAGGGTEYIISPSGSIAFSGAVPLLRGRIFLPTGNINLSGSATQIRGRAYNPTGSILFSGTAAQLHGKLFTPSGNIAFSGSAPLSNSAQYIISPSGSIAFSGGINLIRGRSLTPIGSLSFTGNSNLIRGKLYLPSGSINFTGSPALIKNNTIVPTGNITFSGTAGLIFTPAGGVPNVNLSRFTLGISRAIGLS